MNAKKNILESWKSHGDFSERLKAFEKYRALELEVTKHGLGILTDLRSIVFKEPEYGSTELTINYTIEEMREKGMLFQDFAHFTKKEKEGILAKIAKASPHQLNKFDHLHLAFSDIKILIIPRGLVLEKTLSIDRTFIGNSYNHLIIFADEDSNAKILIKTASSEKEPYILTDFVECFVERNAHLTVVESRNLSAHHVVYSRKASAIEENGQMHWLNIDKDCRMLMTEQRSQLRGDHAQSFMHNIIIDNAKSEYNIYAISEHEGKNTYSLMQGRGILRHAKAIMRGLVKINDHADNSNGYQKSDIMLLENDARAITIPDLEIHNDNVKCTHGSSISRPDAEKTFYLQSRGLSKEESEKIIVDGFNEKIIASVPQDMQETIREIIQ
jgi:Fe-S cluster assembly protein SufD